MNNKSLAAAFACAAFSLSAAAAAAPAVAANGVLATHSGATLYTFDKDAPGTGKSACGGPCAQAWPPLAAGASDAPSGDWTIVTRDDGARQWAYKGWPLYTYSKDAKAGDRGGDNFKNVWHVIKE
jgi:predicted lipoprotein with Yx(FWY)xxD motif